MQRSWRTTTLGIIAIITALGGAASALLDDKPETVPDWAAVVAAVTAGAGLIAARDNSVTSQQLGLSTPPKPGF